MTKRAMAGAVRVMAAPTKRTRAAGDTESGATPTKMAMVEATRAVGDEEGNVEKEGKGPHSSSSSDCLPPRHMLPLLLRLTTTFRAIVGAACRGRRE